MNPSDEKHWARQIVRSSLHEILAGQFKIPNHKEMESLISDNFSEPFDEYKLRSKLRKLHPGWSEFEMADELERQEREYERENRTKMNWFIQGTIREIEKLIKSLNQEITKWKVNNL
jgi:transcription termination factor NusB